MASTPFWETDTSALFGDFGLVVEHPNGDTTRGILDTEDVIHQDDVGDVHVRETVLMVKSGALTALAVGDTLTYDTTAQYKVRRIDVLDDGAVTRIVVVAA